LLASLLLCLLGALPQGFQVPHNDGWVTDLAGVLSPQEERSLEALMESYHAGSGQEIALLVVPDLGGRTVEEAALTVAREWKIGDRETSSGALLLVAMAERKLRIEVGRGLEGTLTDSIAGRIIRDVIVPEFRREHFAEGLRKGIEAIHAALGGDYGPLERGGARGGALALLPALMVFGLFALTALLGRRRGSGRFRRGGSVLPWILADMAMHGSHGSGRVGGFSGGSFGSGGFGGFGGGGGFSGGGASGGW